MQIHNLSCRLADRSKQEFGRHFDAADEYILKNIIMFKSSVYHT